MSNQVLPWRETLGHFAVPLVILIEESLRCPRCAISRLIDLEPDGPFIPSEMSAVGLALCHIRQDWPGVREVSVPVKCDVCAGLDGSDARHVAVEDRDSVEVACHFGASEKLNRPVATNSSHDAGGIGCEIRSFGGEVAGVGLSAQYVVVNMTVRRSVMYSKQDVGETNP